tara:strand:- start:5469 stop:6362 length:894 start_codon:yes stop_codon:yes gene_type:complete
MKIVVTGGRGFIGSHFVEKALSLGHEVIDIDKLTYCASHILPWDNHPNYILLKEDISEIQHLPSCEILINFAAESHVDNSINDTRPFIKSNILGVHNLLELVRGKREYDRPLFFHISTDEVYGDTLGVDFAEGDRLHPSNPYSASKAAAEMLVLSYYRTYGINYLITRSTNNYGERQYEEKLIPRVLSCIKQNKKIPVHGDGSYQRDWLYVKDNVDAIFTIMESGTINEIFNIGTNNHQTNLEVVYTIMDWMNCKDRNLINFVENRWGQDIKYAIDCSKLLALGWHPKNEKLFRWFK